MINTFILARVPDGSRVRCVTINEYKKFLAAKPPNKDKIAEMMYHRFHGRYIKPFMYPDEHYKLYFKSGFAMMASACLLIEAIESFRHGWPQTREGGDQLFNKFFERECHLNAFKEVNFYKHIRCGILHQGETTGGFSIQRHGALFQPAQKKINAHLFTLELEKSLANYKNDLLNDEWDSEIWDNFRRKMRSVIDNCR